ncbi:hypothetical protein L6Q21_04310 [Sandaracinobacter sp. RS1-74]|uniref:hypothetical protein n=1 Tax=Sandaracinobacteroides sayramensis TaxID=2913411 RepID=UPI001ED9ED95|nr:hypothetical protein [Sandaracinobacteroides sayramensis]MCG2840204.1 hypothetical protein [Sandaracinobacteroides sayramensis]
MDSGAPSFDRFVAVDWSGAKGVRHKGIAVALAEAGDGAPAIVPPPSPGGWARGEVADWLEALPGRVLAGFDFSFAPPFVERGAYLPGLETAGDAPGFWGHVERHSDDPDYGAAGFMRGAARPHFWMGAADGPKAGFLHFRQCEQRFNAGGGGKASTVFDCVGAAQVAKASFAGMRLLHRLRRSHAIWPFEAPGPRTVVEIYTRAMLRHAGGRGLKLREVEGLNAALAALGSAGVPARAYSDHETDVLVSAAALRALSPDRRWWRPEGMSRAIARTEGWTFGIG